jgi:hypothetical protein
MQELAHLGGAGETIPGMAAPGRSHVYRHPTGEGAKGWLVAMIVTDIDGERAAAQRRD